MNEPFVRCVVAAGVRSNVLRQVPSNDPLDTTVRYCLSICSTLATPSIVPKNSFIATEQNPALGAQAAAALLPTPATATASPQLQQPEQLVQPAPVAPQGGLSSTQVN